MSPRCDVCGKQLEWVGNGPEWMNSYQWDAIKAGDFFAKCENPTHPNGNCYFVTRDEALVRKPTLTGADNG